MSHDDAGRGGCFWVRRYPRFNRQPFQGSVERLTIALDACALPPSAAGEDLRFERLVLDIGDRALVEQR
ncbi:MAG: hypothetical protein ABW321_25175, partial [Polyangiales bacterium]